jgi:hypothetical protein
MSSLAIIRQIMNGRHGVFTPYKIPLNSDSSHVPAEAFKLQPMTVDP